MHTLLISFWSVFYLSSIYNISVPGINGTDSIHFSDFAGKKILIVNTATGGSFVGQYARLEALYQQNKDSLVIIAIPSNDFGHEANDESTIQSFVENSYHIHYLLAGKAIVTGEGQSPLYNWLTHHSESDGPSSTVNNDFQKYLVGSDGRLMGYFTGAMDPLDSTIVNAIHGQ
jgi:glutathione peroxidase